MMTMSGVWDRAVEVMTGRRAILAALALLLLWLPPTVLAALRSAMLGTAAAGQGSGGHPVLGIVSLAVTLLTILGQLALVAVASNPVVTLRDATGIAARRFLPYVGVAVIVAIVVAVALIPLVAVALGGYPGLTAGQAMLAMQAGVKPQLGTGAVWFLLLYGIALAVTLVWLEARVMALLTPVMVNERPGLAGLARAWRLSRGLTWRLVGVVLLFALVAWVVTVAVRSVVGSVLALALGASGLGLALFLTASIGALVAAALSVVVAAFTAQLYVATRAVQPAA